MGHPNSVSTLALFAAAGLQSVSQAREARQSKAAPKPQTTQSPKVWSSKLERTVATGSGQARSQTLSGLGGFLKSGIGMGAKVVGGLMAGAAGLAMSPLLLLTDGASRLAAARMTVREHGREMAYVKANCGSLDALRARMDPAKCQFGEVATSRFTKKHEAVMKKIVDHARRTGKLAEEGARPAPGKLSRLELQRLVEVGEGVFNLLQETKPGAIKDLKMPGADRPRPLASQYTAKALAWFLMAQAAYKDVQNGVEATPAASAGPSQLRSADFETQGSRGQSRGRVSNMATKGAFFIADPGNRMYEFLNSVPTSGPRMSSHVADRSDASAKHKILGFIPYGNPEQKGIEDYQSTFPGEGGTLMFDKLKPEGSSEPSLFVKFEGAGCPPYFVSGVNEKRSEKVMRFFAANSRNVDHIFNFAKTRNSRLAEDSSQVNRHEHVYKGLLKAGVADPFKSLIKDAYRQGIVDGDAAFLTKGMKQYGLAFVVDAVKRIKNSACELEQAMHPGATAIGQRCEALLETIREENERLGTDERIGRRGAEVHLRIDPMPTRAPAGVNA